MKKQVLCMSFFCKYNRVVLTLGKKSLLGQDWLSINYSQVINHCHAMFCKVFVILMPQILIGARCS